MCWLAGVAAGQTFGPPGVPLENCGRSENPLSTNWATDVVGTEPQVWLANGTTCDTDLDGNAAARWTATSFGPDVEVAIDLPDAVGGNTFVGVLLRIVNPGAAANGYAVWWNTTTAGLLIRELVAGSYVTLNTTPVAVASGDSIGGSAIGDQICSWHKPAAGSWTQVACVTDASVATAGQIGIFASGANYLVDNIWARTVPPAGGGGITFPPPGTPLDTANRADQGPPPSASWTSTVLTDETSGIRVLGNVFARGTAADQGSAWWNAASFDADQAASFVVSDGVGAGSISLYTNLQSPGVAGSTDGYECIVVPDDGTQAIHLQRYDNSVATLLVSQTTTNVNDGDGFACLRFGTTLSAWHKPAAGSWAKVLETTDATYTLGGFAGARFSNTALLTFDDFWAGNVTAVAGGGGGGGQRFVAPLFLH